MVVTHLSLFSFLDGAGAETLEGFDGDALAGHPLGFYSDGFGATIDLDGFDDATEELTGGFIEPSHRPRERVQWTDEQDLLDLAMLLSMLMGPPR